jgi:histidine triad (HIT) family protein
VYEDARVVAFVDLRQAQPGHVLVVPRAHVPRLHLLGAEDAAALMQVAVVLAGAMERVFAPEGLHLWQSNGAACFQEVDHVHLHLHPRALGDGLVRIYPGELPEHAPREELDALAARIRAAL